MDIDYEKLTRGLEQLTGYDYGQAEKQARKLGDTSVDVSVSREFAAVLISKALKCKVDDILALPIREYAKVTGVTLNFLLGTLGMSE